MLDVLFDDVLVELGWCDVEPAVRDDAPEVDWVAPRPVQSDVFASELDVGKRQGRGPAHRGQRGLRARSSGSISVRSSGRLGAQ